MVIKTANELFWHEFEDKLNEDEDGERLGILGSVGQALRSVSAPDVKRTKSTLTGSILRLGDVDTRPDEAFEITIKTGKCTAIARPKPFKKFALQSELRSLDGDGREQSPEIADLKAPNVYIPLTSESKYYVKEDEDEAPANLPGHGGVKVEDNDELLLKVESESQARMKDLNIDDEPAMDVVEEEDKKPVLEEDLGEEVAKEELVRGYKYGATFVPAPDSLFDQLPTKPGMSILSFFEAPLVRICTLQKHAGSDITLCSLDVNTAWAKRISSMQTLRLPHLKSRSRAF